MKKIEAIAVLLFIYAFAYSQNAVIGSFPQLANQTIKLYGFRGFNNYPIDSVKADANGDFTIPFGNNDYGMAYLSAQDNKPFFVVLEGENVALKGESLAVAESIEITQGRENRLFAQYASEHPRREQALSAWGYLEKIYAKDPLFEVQHVAMQAIYSEMQRVKTEDSLFLAALPQNAYVNYYLPLRKLVSSVSTIAQYRTEEIPAAIVAFRNIDYTDPRLYKSGLVADAIESHFWLLENSGRSLDSANLEMHKSIDGIISNLVSDEPKLNEITAHLFKFLEKRSLFNASEYLALRLLNEKSCTLNNDFASQLESYRAMKKGNTAPDFAFGKDLVAPGHNLAQVPKILSDLKSKYIVVVFGASWCPQCPSELSQIALLYEKWKKYDVEVVFVSLDDNATIFKSFAAQFPFISTCDYKKWESPVVKSYHVFGTPTIYLLNNKREILLRPNSASHLDSWIDWFLVKGNK